MNEFLTKLAALRHQTWRLTRGGHLRNWIGQCPICAVSGDENRTEAWSLVHEKAGITRDQGRVIADSADNTTYTPSYSPVLRQQLLEAVGLRGKS